MDRFELPDDYTSLSDTELDELLSAAIQQFDAKAGADAISPKDLEELRQLNAAVQAIRKEKQDRLEAAAQVAAEIDALAAQVRGETPDADTGDGDDGQDTDGDTAPSETVYSLTNMSCPEMLWDLPEVQMARGGLRFFPMPSLDVGAMTWIHTESDDISGATKPCFKIPCPEPVEVRCDAVGVCLESGILTQRHFPEPVAHYHRLAMIDHEIRIKQELYNQAVNQATPVTIAPTFGAFSAIFAAVALQAADMTERLNLCENINIEVVFPWWTRGLMIADIARQNGVAACDIDPRCIIDAFSKLGVSVQWARGLPPAAPPRPRTGPSRCSSSSTRRGRSRPDAAARSAWASFTTVRSSRPTTIRPCSQKSVWLSWPGTTRCVP